MRPLDLKRFLREQGLTPAALARHLRVSETYLGTVLEGQEVLGERDQAACLALAARLARARRALRAAQMELPFAERPEAFTREYARQQARAHAAKRAKPTPRKKGSRTKGT